MLKKDLKILGIDTGIDTAQVRIELGKEKALQSGAIAVYDTNTGVASYGGDVNEKWYNKSAQELFIQPAKRNVISGTKYVLGGVGDFVGAAEGVAVGSTDD